MSKLVPKRAYEFWIQEIPVKEPIGFLLLQKTTSRFLLIGIISKICIKPILLSLFLGNPRFFEKFITFWKIYNLYLLGNGLIIQNS